MLITGFYASVADWRIISIILQAIPVIATFLLYAFYAEETPMFLLKGGNETALKALNRMGDINKGLKDIISEEDIDNVRKEQLAE
jgi:hypothetical protein